MEHLNYGGRTYAAAFLTRRQTNHKFLNANGITLYAVFWVSRRTTPCGTQPGTDHSELNLDILANAGGQPLNALNEPACAKIGNR